LARSPVALAGEAAGAQEHRSAYPSLTDDPGPRSAAPGGLIARVRELAHLDHVLWRARRGTGSAVALRGEPGVGKSALIEATVARASDFTIVQLRGTAVADREAVPREWPRPLAELLAGNAPDPGPEATVEALQAILRSATSSLLLAVDDCHLLPPWFPGALTRAVTDSLARAPLVLVLAWRDTPHRPTFELGSTAVAEHRLGGLTLDQSRTLLRQQHLHLPAPAVLTTLVGATAGNPHALLDVCARLDPDELNGWRPLPEPVPVGDALASAFGASVAVLPDEVRSAVAAAAAGRVPLDVLELVLDQLDLSSEALIPAEEAGILVVRGNRIDFLHPLVRAAAFRLAPEEVRAQIHQATGRAFGRSGHVERSAFHASQGRGVPDDALTRLYGQAARVALDRGDPESAARHEEMASAFAETSDTRAHHLSRAAGLWMTVGHTQRSLVCLDRAADLHPSGSVLAEVVYQRARADSNHDVGGAVADEMLAAAALCEAETPHRAVLMLADAAACMVLGGSSTGTADVAERAVALAGAVSSHAEALARATLGAVGTMEGRTPTAHRSEVRAASSLLIGQTQRFSGSPQLAYVIGISLLYEGQREQTTRWAQWIEHCAETLGDRALAVVPPALQAAVALRDGRLSEALAAAETSADRARRCEDRPLAARALALVVEVHAARGEYEQAFQRASGLFALTADTGREPRLQALTALANLELQRGRMASAFAWLAASEEETPVAEEAAPAYDPIRARWAPPIAEVMILGRRAGEATALVDVVDRASNSGAVPRSWSHWIRGIAADEIDAASEHFRAVLTAVRGAPLHEARVELLWGVRLAEAGRHEEARARLGSAAEQFRLREASGWSALVEQEFDRLPSGPSSGEDDTYDEGRSGEPATLVARRSSEGHLRRPGAAPAVTTPPPTWEICLLGSFAVRRHGKDVSLPLSLAAQGLKIVTLRERIPVEELVELLWADAEPGVGTRRLRNVLWRVRAACGELLEREGNFIRLSPDAVTDVSAFRSLAEQALRPDGADPTPVQLARKALDLYRGELLPGDRYADWASPSRESLARLHLQLLELLLAEAVRHEHGQEALGLLDRLIEADPYEEHYYLQAAELHARAGNRRRALSIIGRAERMLGDLGVAPSPALGRVRNSLGTA